MGKEKADVKKKPQGVESWKDKDGAALVARQADISWLIRSFEISGLSSTPG
jgi:hypothetical protein